MRGYIDSCWCQVALIFDQSVMKSYTKLNLQLQANFALFLKEALSQCTKFPSKRRKRQNTVKTRV